MTVKTVNKSQIIIYQSLSHHFQVDQPLRAVIVFLAGFETEGGAPELGAEFIMRK